MITEPPTINFDINIPTNCSPSRPWLSSGLWKPDALRLKATSVQGCCHPTIFSSFYGFWSTHAREAPSRMAQNSIQTAIPPPVSANSGQKFIQITSIPGPWNRDGSINFFATTYVTKTACHRTLIRPVFVAVRHMRVWTFRLFLAKIRTKHSRAVRSLARETGTCCVSAILMDKILKIV